MPRRRGSSLGRLTAQAKRQRELRGQENNEETETRRSQDRARHSSQREQETTPEREQRLAADIHSHTTRRQEETTPEREQRLAADIHRHTTRRQQETTPEREQRLAADIHRHTTRRQQETTPEREHRLAADIHRHTTRRQQETTPEREQRLAADIHRHTTRRQQETTPEREQRLAADIHRHTTRRQQETTPEREHRLAADIHRHTTRRQQETTPEREQRLAADIHRHTTRRQQETTPEREQRLAADIHRHTTRRQQETTPEREQRLAADIHHHTTRRQQETTPEREQRLAADIHRHTQQRLQESAAQHAARLERDRVTHSTLRTEQLLNSDSEFRSQVRVNVEANSTLDVVVASTSTGYVLPRCRWSSKPNSGKNYDSKIEYRRDGAVSLGQMEQICQFCFALKFKDESTGLCCKTGKISLPVMAAPPEPLLTLISGQHTQSNHFIKNILQYNNAFSMTSFGAQRIVESGYMPTFKVQGQVYHLIGSLLPQNSPPKFLQIYFINNPEAQTDARTQRENLDRPIVRSLQDMLEEHNNYVNSFRSAIESVPPNTPDYQLIIHAERTPAGDHAGRYNAPATDEVAVLIQGQEFAPRDIVLHGRDDTLQRISELHRAYDALQYPLMHVRGEDGYCINLPQIDPHTGQPRAKTISSMAFYAYRMMVRTMEFNTMLRFGMLSNQYWVDQYAKIEAERLRFIRNNQASLRADSYIHLQDALRADAPASAADIGQPVVLPSSFTAGPRYMHERTQDAMVYVRHYGTPDLFITMTCNTSWPEIVDNLLPNTTPQSRYDIVDRVFHLKVQKLLHLLNKGEIFGTARCHMYTIEWQKRGLPHVHLLLWLRDKLQAHEIDSVISAEIPRSDDSELFTTVTRHMLHGPCGALNPRSPCMKDNRCTKRYPKPYRTETSTSADNYPTYRRRAPADGGHTAELPARHLTLDNAWVVPHNPVLLRAFDAHINVEFCNSVHSIKYVCKYINKGSDQAVFTVNAPDEIDQFVTGRYISTSEAIWRVLGFSIHDRYPTVVHLAVHLENGQRVYFTHENAADVIENPRETSLTAFFGLCSQDVFARTLLYHEVPSYYTWNGRQFTRRRQGVPVEGFASVRRSDALGRVYTVHPANSECYHLRLLLHAARGPTSYRDLRTVDGVLHETYQAAAQARGLLLDDAHWHHTLQEAALHAPPAVCRALYITMLAFCAVAEPRALWEAHKTAMAEDFLHRLERAEPDREPDDAHLHLALREIDERVRSLCGTSAREMGLPVPDDLPAPSDTDREMAYDTDALRSAVDSGEPRLNTEQRSVYERVLNSVHGNEGATFFLDAPGGTGKTYLLNLLLAKLRSTGLIALAVASSGIAATLLDGGRTAHSMFKLPLNLARDADPVCHIEKQSPTAKLLQRCSLIVWDEASASHKKAIEALDRTLRDVRSQSDVTMGGVTCLLSGDFRQTLPVVQRGTRADEVNACLKQSHLWPLIQKMSLTTNMRALLSGDETVNRFSATLLDLGNGQIEEMEGCITLDNEHLCQTVTTLPDLISHIYPSVEQSAERPLEWFRERAILAPRNAAVDAINASIMAVLPSESRTYRSVDSVLDEGDAVNYPVEFLNSLTPPGLPAHELQLKKGCVVMLLRNLDPPRLCNGTRLQLLHLHQYVLEARVASGPASGDVVLLPRLPMAPSDLPVPFQRLQFPVRVCFTMTINKSQGQTLRVAGVDLRDPCFSHGQLYVACSRVSSPASLYVLVPDPERRRTPNIVYREALR